MNVTSNVPHIPAPQNTEHATRAAKVSAEAELAISSGPKTGEHPGIPSANHILPTEQNPTQLDVKA